MTNVTVEEFWNCCLGLSRLATTATMQVGHLVDRAGAHGRQCCGLSAAAQAAVTQPSIAVEARSLRTHTAATVDSGGRGGRGDGRELARWRQSRPEIIEV